MRIFLVLISLTISFQAFAAKKHGPHNHDAHVHGSGSLSIAFDGPQGKIEFNTPSETLFGFEHEAKTAADKKTVNDALKKFENSLAEMISFKKELNCQFTKDKLEVVFESKKHSNTQAAFTVKCEKSPVGSRVLFNFQKFFPRLKDVDTQIIADQVQKSLKIKSTGDSIDFF